MLHARPVFLNFKSNPIERDPPTVAKIPSCGHACNSLQEGHANGTLKFAALRVAPVVWKESGEGVGGDARATDVVMIVWFLVDIHCGTRAQSCGAVCSDDGATSVFNGSRLWSVVCGPKDHAEKYPDWFFY